MKVIFLDFDGVITTEASGYKIDNDKCKLVEKICIATGAKIVISSSWRRRKLCDTLDEIGWNFYLKKYVIGQTPVRDMERYIEISNWLSCVVVDNFIVIDDDVFSAPFIEKHLIRTDGYKGISEQDVEQAIKLLSNE